MIFSDFHSVPFSIYKYFKYKSYLRVLHLQVRDRGRAERGEAATRGPDSHDQRRGCEEGAEGPRDPAGALLQRPRAADRHAASPR